MDDIRTMGQKTAPEPRIWYCPSCKKMRGKDTPDGRETILGIQHGDTLVIKHKDIRIEVEAEGRIGVTCRVCGAFSEVYSEDWLEIKKFKERLAEERKQGGPPIRKREIIGYTQEQQ